MHNIARAPGVTGILQVDGQPGMPVGLRLESSYLIVEMTADRDAVAVEFLRRSRVRDYWHLRRTDRPGWQISTGDFPTAWRAQVRRANMSAAARISGAAAIVAALLAIARAATCWGP